MFVGRYRRIRRERSLLTPFGEFHVHRQCVCVRQVLFMNKQNNVVVAVALCSLLLNLPSNADGSLVA